MPRGVERAAILIAMGLALIREPTAHGAPSLAEELRRAGRQDVLLVQEQSAIVARTPCGRFVRRIAKGAGSVQYDPARELLWLRQEDSLNVLDLRRARPEPITIVENLGGARIEVRNPGDTARPFWEDVRLVWSQRSRLEPNVVTEEPAGSVRLRDRGGSISGSATSCATPAGARMRLARA